MRSETWILVSLVVALQVMAACALGGYPGTFYHIMMILNRGRKNPRTAPSPNQLWAIMDPPASLGSLSKEHLNTNRITRSVEDFKDEELQRQELRQEDPVTEPPEELGEPVTEEPEEVVTEVETEPPVTTEAPIVCGGDLTIGINPNNLTIPDGLVFSEVLETPGWEDGEYPEDFECEWNLNVQKDCLMGMTIFKVTDGHIRESVNCQEDYLKITLPSAVSSKYCGAVVSGGYSVEGTDLWTVETEVPRTIQIVFNAAARGASNDGGNPQGVQIEVSSYCWAFTQDLLSRTTTTTTTTTAAPATEDESETNVEDTAEVEEEVVTEVAEDITEAPVDDSETAVASNDAKVIIEDLSLEDEVVEEQKGDGQKAPVSLLGGDPAEAGSPDNLIPSNILPEGPGAPIAPAGAISAGLIPVVPLRGSRSNWTPLFEANGMLRRK